MRYQERMFLLFRPFVAPEPIASPGPPTPPSGDCRPVDSALEHYELDRQASALDTALRAQGGQLLPVSTTERSCGGQTCVLGATFRGANGERWMFVGSDSCGGYVPPVAMDAQRAIFQVIPDPQPTRSHPIRACTPGWSRCGPLPAGPVLWVVEVPEDAHWVGSRAVSFPIDVLVRFLPALGPDGRPLPPITPP